MTFEQIISDYTSKYYRWHWDEDPRVLFKCLTIAYEQEVRAWGKECDLIKDDSTRERVREAERWMRDDKSQGIILSGALGTGKTSLCKAIKAIFQCFKKKGLPNDDQKQFNRKQFNVIMLSARDIWHNYNDNFAQFDQFKKVSVLIIDDLGTEPPTCQKYGNDLAPMEELISARSEYPDLLTVISTNLTIEQLTQRYGERFHDRIKGFHQIIFKGLSHR